MTWVTPTPTSASAGVPATKFGIAIGKRREIALGNDDALRSLAEGIADVAPPVSTPSEAIPERICRRLGRNGISRN